MKNTMKSTMFVAALAAMILGQASVSAADSTPAILKSVKAKQTLNKGQMKKVKGEHYVAYNYNYAYNNAYLYNGKYNPYLYNGKYNNAYLYNGKYNNAYLYNGFCFK